MGGRIKLTLYLFLFSLWAAPAYSFHDNNVEELAGSGESALPEESFEEENLEDVRAVEALEQQMFRDLQGGGEPLFIEPEGCLQQVERAFLNGWTDVPTAEGFPYFNQGEGCSGSPLFETDYEPGMGDGLPPFDLSGIAPVFGLSTLEYEPIQRYLQFWTTDGRRRLTRMLSRGGRYKEFLSTALNEAGLPQELFYLVLVESGFSPTALSSAGAVGLWQFMERTGSSYGLQIDRELDERMDVARATESAIAFLSYLYDRFESWPLAMAAYNAGGGHVRSELRRYNTNDFWRLDDYGAIWDQTRRYVYMIITAAIIGEHPERFGFSGIVYEEPVPVEVVEIPGDTRLSVIARAARCDVETLLELNPSLLTSRTPSSEAHYLLRIPAESLPDFISRYDDYVAGEAGQHHIHTLRFGETVEELAGLLGENARVLRYANGLSSRDDVPYFSDILLPLPPETAASLIEEYIPQPRGMNESETRPVVIVPDLINVEDGRGRVFYEIQSDDQLADIARAFGVNLYELATWNDIDPGSAIHSQMTLQVYLDEGEDLSAVRYIREDQVQPLVFGSEAYVAWNEAEENRRRSSVRHYTIRSGDTLSGVAQRFGVSSRDLVRWNNLDSADHIVVGQRIQVRR